jgi:two-component system sensor histidine kinase KdpD
VRRAAAGSVAGLAITAVFTAALVPLRSQLSIATVGLILVIPVVAGVVMGGVGAGFVSVAAGFVTFDLVFIPPYYTLGVGAGQNWVVLGVYAVVMMVVARVVSRLQEARAEAQRRAAAAQRLLAVSEILVTDQAPDDIVQSTVDAVRSAFGVSGVALLLPGPSGLELGATSGDAPAPEDLAALMAGPRMPVPIEVGVKSGITKQTVPLVASGRPVGILALRGVPEAGTDLDLLQTFVNQVALAVERGQLREQALRSQLLEEGDRVRRALLGAVSHDLRTPLAAMKVASTSLIDSEQQLEGSARRELYELLDGQVDRLGRLVTGLLDMNRYQSGALELHVERCRVGDLVEQALESMGPALVGRPVDLSIPAAASVQADRLLIGQVLVNLLDNADRHGPPGTAISVSAVEEDSVVRISVEDEGTGVPEAEHEAVFESFFRSDSGGRAGLGLWICRTFVEAHGQRIWVEDAHPGARFEFTLAAA